MIAVMTYVAGGEPMVSCRNASAVEPATMHAEGRWPLVCPPCAATAQCRWPHAVVAIGHERGEARGVARNEERRGRDFGGGVS